MSDSRPQAFSLHISRETFKEYLEELDGQLEMPDTSFMQYYDTAARNVVDLGMALRHHAANLSDLALEVRDSVTGAASFFRVPPPEAVAAAATSDIPVIVRGVRMAPAAAPGIDAGERIRFPYNAALFDIVDTYFDRNVPAEMWLSSG